MDRRSLFRSAAASGLLGIAATAARGATETGAIAAPLVTGPQRPMPRLPQSTGYGELHGERLYRTLGWTSECVSAIGFGGSLCFKPAIDQATSDRLCHAALDQASRAANSFRPTSPAEAARSNDATPADALNGEFELLNTKAHFDGTVLKPDWLGPDRGATPALAQGTAPDGHVLNPAFQPCL